MTTQLAIHGAAGRMGQRLVALGHADETLHLVAAVEWEGHPQFGMDAGTVAGIGEIGLPLTNTLPEGTQAVIDFSVPMGAESITKICLEQRVPLVMATTGLSDEQQDLLKETSTKTAVVWAPNMSLAVNLTMKLSEIAAEALQDLPGGADVEIIERHHRYKQDAPSGTALKFGELIANIMKQKEHVHGREGITGERSHGEIGYHALRTGDDPGQHTIVFGMLGETIELKVGATNRDCYALGALRAAQWVQDKEPGLYNMYDVLGI